MDPHFTIADAMSTADLEPEFGLFLRIILILRSVLCTPHLDFDLFLMRVNLENGLFFDSSPRAACPPAPHEPVATTRPAPFARNKSRENAYSEEKDPVQMKNFSK